MEKREKREKRRIPQGHRALSATNETSKLYQPLPKEQER
jgi:hypothetical protein